MTATLLASLALAAVLAQPARAQTAPPTTTETQPPDAQTQAAPAETTLTFAPYTIHGLDGVDRPAELGRLRVPELHAHPEGRKIAIVFIRLRSPAPAPGPPVLFLPGGPGYPGTLLARTPPYLELFEKLRASSDVIVLDQRGAGLSEPTLQCATRGSLPLDAFATEAKTANAIGSILRPCVRLVRNDGVAIEAYNTAESAEDIEDLRRALGVERVRLIGVSYGTELALEMIRRHGERVDAAVLAGTRGPDMAWRLPSVNDAQLKRVSALVARDPQWARDLPDFEASVRRLLERLSWRPARIPIRDAKSGKDVRVRIGPVAIQAILGSDLNDWARAPLLPAIFASLAHGDSTLLARRVEELVNTTAAGISVMQVATDCASGASPERRARVAREAPKSLLGNVKNMLVNPAFCDLVGGPDLGPGFRAPIQSPVRTLFLTGSLDGITPPAQAEEARRGFPNGVHLIVENGWHEVLPFDEVQQAMIDFFGGNDVSGRRLELPTPRFASIAETKALTAPRR